MAVKKSWPGRFYDDFEIGDLIEHTIGRTITNSDNIWFTLITMNQNPIHFDKVYAAKTEFKELLVDSTFTLALVTGLSVNDISRNAINLGWDEIRLHHPVFEGDTLYAKSEVLSKRLSNSRPHMGIISFKTTGYNQDEITVIDFKRTIMIYRHEHAID